jgi:periplasmic protein TonB
MDGATTAADAGIEPQEPESSYVTVNLHDAPAARASQLDWVPARFRNAMGVSVVVHVGAALLVLLLLSLEPTRTAEVLGQRFEQLDMVFLDQPGPGGGGGGGGNRQPTPPRKIELPGRDKISVPVVKPAPVEPLKPTPPKPEPPQEQQLKLPVVAVQSGITTLPGAINTAPPAPTTSQGPGSGGGAGTGQGGGVGPGQGSGLGPGYGGGTGGGVYRPGSGIVSPRVLKEVKPQYTSEAMRAKIQGEVTVECVVTPQGRCTNIRVIRSLDPTFGLDQQAVKAASDWVFAPGTRQGQPVAVLISIEMSFTLR